MQLSTKSISNHLAIAILATYLPIYYQTAYLAGDNFALLFSKSNIYNFLSHVRLLLIYYMLFCNMGVR